MISYPPEAFRHTREDSSQPPSITQGFRQGRAFALAVKDRPDFPERYERASEIEPEVNRQLESVASLGEVFQRAECLLEPCRRFPVSRAR